MIKLLLSKTSLFFSILLCTSGMVSAQSKSNGFILQNEAKLDELKKQYKGGDADVTKTIATLLADADKALTKEAYSVTYHKTQVAPSGNPHDYVSQAPYFWADPTKPDGKPYIRKDGERNPEIYRLHDDTQLNELCQDVRKLGFAYYLTGKDTYVQKAIAQMKVFFVDTATRMNPNLNYAQYIPGVNDGRGIGIIESRALANIPDAFAMMKGSKAFSPEVLVGVKIWFGQYLEWLHTSKNGNDEHNSKNNHGTIYDMQVIDYAIFTGNEKMAYNMLKDQTISRMETQFTKDGKQPLELERTKSWNYSCMNLDGWCKLAILGDRLGIDLWHTTTGGKSIEKCIAWLMPFLLKEQNWSYKQIEKMGYGEMIGICTMADGKYPAIDFAKPFAMYPASKPWNL